MTYQLNLEVFEGPFDLLLYLIKKDEINIYDIPIAKILEEYTTYLELMQQLDLEVAGEFIVMAATLMHIKSRMLLPQESLTLEGEEMMDPRAELVRRLLEYKRFKEVAESLDGHEARQREIFWRRNLKPEEDEIKAEPVEEDPAGFSEVNLFDLLSAFKSVLDFAQPETFREIDREEIKTSQKINEVLDELDRMPELDFRDLLLRETSRMGMISVFLAILELVRLKAIRVTQDQPFGRILLCRVEEFTAQARQAAGGVEE